MENDLFQDTNTESKKAKLFGFHIIEIILVSIYFLIYMMRASFNPSANISILVMSIFSIILLYQIVRIIFEYKNQLITGPGIVLKIFLLTFTSVIFSSMWMKIIAHPLANIMATSALLSMIFPYLIFALALDKITKKNQNYTGHKCSLSFRFSYRSMDEYFETSDSTNYVNCGYDNVNFKLAELYIIEKRNE